MRGVIVFAAGLLAGVAIHSVAAQEARIPGMHLNHVMLRVPDLAQAKKFYMDTFGWTEAFYMAPEDGSPPYMYLQVSKDTFVELMQASAGNPPGLVHFGFEVRNVHEAVKGLRQRGLTAEDPVLTRTKALITHVDGPPGVRFELGEYRPPDSLVWKAMNSWK